jgi:hypothetical protein
MPEDARIAETLLTLARANVDASGFCPSDAARALAPQDWRPLIPRMRQVISRLQRDGLINVTQEGLAVDALGAEGPIRLSRPLH